MTSKRRSLASNSLHHTSITQKGICIVVDDLETRLVEFGRGMMLSNGKTNGVGETLTERSSSNFNSIGIMGLGVARSN
jgi:hypothetical protein